LAASTEGAYRFVVLDVTADTASTAELFYSPVGGAFDAEHRLEQPVEVGRHRIVFDVSAVTDTGAGEMSLRIDPAQSAGITVHSVDVLDIPG
jgi:hypothetical protein